MEIKVLSFEHLNDKKESAPEILLNPEEIKDSPQTTNLHSKIIDKNTGEEVGWIDFKLSKSKKVLIVDNVDIKKKKQGYGESTYRLLQSMYPDYTLVSSKQMNKKDNLNQEKPNAVYLWEKLVRLGYAEGDMVNGFRMKKTDKATQ